MQDANPHQYEFKLCQYEIKDIFDLNILFVLDNLHDVILDIRLLIIFMLKSKK